MSTMKQSGCKKGFTLTEVMVASAVMIIAVAMSLTAFVFVLRSTRQAEIQTKLDQQIQIAMERLKYDLRLSSRDKILYYPPGSGITYTAVSFPVPTNDYATGQVALDSLNNIVWGKTVIYHAWTAPFSNQLRVTTFTPRNNSRTDAERQTQLAQVVLTGDGTDPSVLDNDDAITEVVFENVFEWNIAEMGGDYDGYSPTVQREQNAKLGSVLIGPGAHSVKFTVLSNNPACAANGYKIGIDALSVSASGSSREGEAQTVTSTTLGLQTNYMPNGSWDGNYQLYFPASTTNQSFTLSIVNDKWENTNFRGTGEILDDTTVDWDTSLSPWDFVVRLTGMETNWYVTQQTADAAGFGTNQLMGSGIRVVIRGGESAAGGWITADGANVRLRFKSGNGQALMISNASIAQAIGDGPDFVAGTSVPVTFSNGLLGILIPANSNYWSDYITFPGGIDSANSYLVSYMVVNDHLYDRAWAWNDTNYPAVSGSFVFPNATYTDMSTNHWDSTQYVAQAALIAVENMQVSYASNGYYTSEAFDTRMTNSTVNYSQMSWNAYVPTNTSVKMQVRTGNQPDMSDAAAWGTNWLTASPYAMGAGGRYVQFKAMLSPDPNGLTTPKLKDVSIQWAGETKVVDVSGSFTKGPDYGIFQCTVDGVLLRSAVGVTMSIYESAPVYGGGTNTITSTLTEEIEPRNTGR